MIRLNLALSFPTGIGNPEALKLILPPEDGVASLVSPSVASARLVDKDNLVGILSLVLGVVEPRASKIEEKIELVLTCQPRT